MMPSKIVALVKEGKSSHVELLNTMMLGRRVVLGEEHPPAQSDLHYSYL